jgi:hypothetical protein
VLEVRPEFSFLFDGAVREDAVPFEESSCVAQSGSRRAQRSCETRQRSCSGRSPRWEDRAARYREVAEVRSREFGAHAEDELFER